MIKINNEMSIEEQAKFIAKSNEKEWVDMLYRMEIPKYISPTFFVKINIPSLKKESANNQGSGPTLSDGSIIGDFFAWETSNFTFRANADQRLLGDYLLEENFSDERYKEYVLVILGKIEVWKRDIETLRIMGRSLKEDVQILNGELKYLYHSIKTKKKNIVSDFFKKYLPKLALNIEKEVKTEDDLLNNQVEISENMIEIRLAIAKEIKKLRKEYPFLFKR